MFLGWLCGADPSHAALRAAASLELLHAFALLQDDVMDGSPLRRGRPSAHVQFADWHRDRGCRARRSASASRPRSCSATCAWSGPSRCCATAVSTTTALNRAWPRYDAMRTELAVGQFADLVNDVGGLPTLDEVLEVARRKSGNYTVRRPLEIGAAMAGCGDRLLARLGAYGDAVGEAFQLRDDLLGIFGSPAITGKPGGADLWSTRRPASWSPPITWPTPRCAPAGGADERGRTRRGGHRPVARLDHRHRRSAMDRR